MDCKKCDFENPDNMRFCGQCAAPLNIACPSCRFENPFDFEFCGQCATYLTKPSPVVSGTPPTAAHPSPQPKEPSRSPPSSQANERRFKSSTTKPKAAERRQLTVLFCDMVGSSALSARIDPEELRDIMSDYRSICSEVVDRYDGHVAQYLGDGVLVYFGFPRAHEDDARRAAHAALEIVKRIPQQRYPVQQGDDIQLAVRVGVHTGLVVVGEIGGGDKRSMALGETPNIAARIQDHADQNTVIISEDTLHLLGDRFDCESLGDHPLKGFSQPIELFHVTQVRTQKNRFLGKRRKNHNKIVGRDQETDLILERFKQARKGVGQVVLLNGDPGLGKTRMVQMICEMAADDQCTILDCCGAPYYKNSFLFPVMDMVRRIIGLTNNSDEHQQLSRIQQTIATLGMDTQTVTPVLAELLSIPMSDSNDTQLEIASFTPQQKKLQTLNTLVELLKTLAQQRFILLVVEDLQWVDPSTIELLSQLINQPGLSNIFAVFTFRNEFSSPWQPRANLTQITLNRLTQKQSGSMIRQLCERKTLPMEVFTEIISKTDGIPFFVEELTNNVLRSSLLIEKEDHFELSSNMSQLGIPSTLQDSLMSRLDDLGEDKELAQISATLGREFNHELLSAVSKQDETQFQASINRLLNAELFFQQGQAPQAHYRFQHALLRETAYHSLLKRTRKKYHQRIATLIKDRFPNIAIDNPEILAHHYTEAECYNDALKYWLAAGRYAIQRSANIEASAHLNSGLAIFKKIPRSPQTSLLELALQTTLGLAIMMSKGYAAPEVEKAYARAHDMCVTISEENTIFPVLYGLWEFYIVRADMKEAFKLANELQQVAARSKVQSFLQEAQRALGTTQFWKGELSEALTNLELPIDAETENPTSQSTLVAYSQDAQVAAHANASCVLWLLGHPKQAVERGKLALDLAKQLSHPFSQAYALNFLGTLAQLCGDPALTYQYADAQIALSETYGFSFWAATGRMLKTWSEAANQAPEVTCQAFQQALNDYEKSGNRLARSYFQSILTGLYQQAGKLEEAQRVIEIALRESSTGEGFFNAELLRLKGELVLAQHQPDYAAAENFFIDAHVHACSQNANALALRAATSLAHLLNSQKQKGRTGTALRTSLDEAKTRLKICLNQFTDEKRTADILIAQQLLATVNRHDVNTMRNEKTSA